MAVAVVQEWPVEDRSTENYDAIDKRIAADGVPEGLILHCAGFAGDRFRIFDVWESSEHFDRFMAERLMPAVQAVVPGDAPPPDLKTYELHNVITP
jgi:hypothetical protein